jgi:hypothetical protein
VGVYAIRIAWYLRFRLAGDKSRARGSRSVGAAYSFTTIARPWSMESTRKGLWQWLEFGIFHIGIGVTIAYSFIEPAYPDLFTPLVNTILVLTQVFALAAGLIRVYKRFFHKKIRLVSSADDFFSLIAVNLLFVTCLLTLLEVPYGLELYSIWLTVVIVYEPFSKLQHYIFYPFARYYYGTYLGHRGIYR